MILVLVLVIAYDVTMRYLFHIGSVALQELEWHLFALIFLLGAAYTLKHDGHVRVDVFYNSKLLSPKHRAWINLLGVIFLLFPFSLLIVISSWQFVLSAYSISEGSPDPGGLPFRFVLKSVIPLAFGLLIFQGIAMALRSFQVLIGKRGAHSISGSDAQV